MRISRTLTIGMALVALAGCSTGQDATETNSPTATLTTESSEATEARPTETETTTESPTETVTETEVVRPDDPDSPPVPANTEPDSADSDGDPVNVTALEIARHETHDRIVFELSGAGTPGWQAQYVDQASAQGSGEPIEVQGDATLQLSLQDVEYPPADGRIDQGERTDLGTRNVSEVQIGTVFEGDSQFVIGVEERTAFRVFALDDPSRIVLDVVHADAAG